MTVDSDGEQRQLAAVVELVVAVARSGMLRPPSNQLIALTRSLEAAGVGRARVALDLFDHVRAMTWRLVQPRK